MITIACGIFLGVFAVWAAPLVVAFVLTVFFALLNTITDVFKRV